MVFHLPICRCLNILDVGVFCFLIYDSRNLLLCIHCFVFNTDIDVKLLFKSIIELSLTNLFRINIFESKDGFSFVLTCANKSYMNNRI